MREDHPRDQANLQMGPIEVKLIDLINLSLYLIDMALTSSHLEAFSEVIRCGSFSKAAQNLHITQSALSQRIINLENELATALIIRDPSGLRLTPAGKTLLRYCQTKTSLEDEVLAQIAKATNGIAGIIRIGAFSSVARSVIMPALSDLMLKYQDVTIELCSRELGELTRLLSTSEVDFIVSMSELEQHDIESHLLGYEENVLIESAVMKPANEVYFDHDADDETTIKFFNNQKGRMPKTIRRNYLDEVYSLIDAVSLGWGRAVVPLHLIKNNKSICILPNYKPLRIPIYLQYYRQPFYSKLHQMVCKELTKNVPAYLIRK